MVPHELRVASRLRVNQALLPHRRSPHGIWFLFFRRLSLQRVAALPSSSGSPLPIRGGMLIIESTASRQRGKLLWSAELHGRPFSIGPHQYTTVGICTDI